MGHQRIRLVFPEWSLLVRDNYLQSEAEFTSFPKGVTFRPTGLFAIHCLIAGAIVTS